MFAKIDIIEIYYFETEIHSFRGLIIFFSHTRYNINFDRFRHRGCSIKYLMTENLFHSD